RRCSVSAAERSLERWGRPRWRTPLLLLFLAERPPSRLPFRRRRLLRRSANGLLNGLLLLDVVSAVAGLLHFGSAGRRVAGVELRQEPSRRPVFGVLGQRLSQLPFAAAKIAFVFLHERDAVERFRRAQRFRIGLVRLLVPASHCQQVAEIF